MIWGNGWAWLGLLAVVVPVVVHLLTRREVRPVAFPAVRFLPVTVPAATRRRRVDDWLRLLFRCGIVALAAAALAQPWLATPGRVAAAGGTVFRAVVVDASESMARPADDGRPGLEVARETAGTLAGDANLSRVIETANLAGGIEAARVWIDRTARGSRSEIVVISDFQAGAFDRADLMRLAPETGVTLRRVAVRAGGDVALAAVTIGGETFRPSVTLAGDG